MKTTITIECTTLDDLKAALEMAAKLQVPAGMEMVTRTVEGTFPRDPVQPHRIAVQDTPASTLAVAVPEKKATRKAKSPPPAAANPLALSEVREKLSSLFDAQGRAPVAAILQRHGAPSVSDLLPAQYESVVADATAALGAQ